MTEEMGLQMFPENRHWRRLRDVQPGGPVRPWIRQKLLRSAPLLSPPLSNFVPAPLRVSTSKGQRFNSVPD